MTIKKDTTATETALPPHPIPVGSLGNSPVQLKSTSGPLDTPTELAISGPINNTLLLEYKLSLDPPKMTVHVEGQ